jgi:ribosomal protein S18 acetylase RimI-like enzyme
MIRNATGTVEPVATPHGTLRLRPETDADTAFLLTLHESVKGAELALMPVPESMRRQLLDMQFRSMTLSYRSGLPEGYFAIVTLDDVPIGRLITDASQGWFHIVHIAFLPEWRNRGIGTVLMTAVLSHPMRQGLRCEATVAPDNLPSLRLWSRLGFTERDRDDANIIVEWRPA